MFMVRGLRSEYSELLLEFRKGNRTFSGTDLGDITSWCNWWDESDFMPATRRPASANATRAGPHAGSKPPSNFTSPWDWIAELSYSTIKDHFRQTGSPCLACGGTADGHGKYNRKCRGLKDCPLLRQALFSQNLKLVSSQSAPDNDQGGGGRDQGGRGRGGRDSNRNAGGRNGDRRQNTPSGNAAAAEPDPQPPPTGNASPADAAPPGPAGLAASVEPAETAVGQIPDEGFSSGSEFEWDGDEKGTMIQPSGQRVSVVGKYNATVSPCLHSSSSTASITLPPALLQLFENPAAHSIPAELHPNICWRNRSYAAGQVCIHLLSAGPSLKCKDGQQNCCSRPWPRVCHHLPQRQIGTNSQRSPRHSTSKTPVQPTRPLQATRLWFHRRQHNGGHVCLLSDIHSPR